jgi:hypothetical protein
MLQFNKLVESFLDRYGSWENYKQSLLQRYNYTMVDVKNLYRAYQNRAQLSYDELKVLKAFYPELFR